MGLQLGMQSFHPLLQCRICDKYGIMQKMMNVFYRVSAQDQRGVAAVEFALVASLLLILLFGIAEFGRMFYVFNTVQEVTRHAARMAVVNEASVSSRANIKNSALFDQKTMPAGAEVGIENIDIHYLTEELVRISESKLPTTGEDNLSACSDPSSNYDCIAFVRVSIIGATYAPMVSFFSGINITAFPFSEKEPFRVDLRIPIPASTVTMPAESMGYSG